MSKKKRGVEWLRSRLEEIQAEYDEYRSPQAFRDQEWARAYEESGCTQQEIADVHGCGRTIVTYRLVFGRFLRWVVTSGDALPRKTLTERRFRRAWEQTPKHEGEEPRFEAVVEILLHPWRPHDVIQRIKDTYRVGQWFTAEEFSEESGIYLGTIKASLARMKSGRDGAVVMDDRPHKATKQYRIRERLESNPKIDMAHYGELVSDIEAALKEAESIVIGKTWTTAGPKLVEEKLSLIRIVLRKARKFIRENSSSPASGKRRKERGLSVLL